MDYSSKTKMELLVICNKLGIMKCKSKNKSQLIQLINSKTQIVEDTLSTILCTQSMEYCEDTTQPVQLNSIDLFCGCGGMSKGFNS